MTSKTRDIITAKLLRLEEYLGYLRELTKYSKKAFLSDHHIYGLAERYLQLCIEIIIDIGKLIIIDCSFPRPESNHEVFETLYEKKVISSTLFKRIRGIAGFRNILVHDYMKINRAIVHDSLKQGIKDFQDFSKAVTKKFGPCKKTRKAM